MSGTISNLFDLQHVGIRANPIDEAFINVIKIYLDKTTELYKEFDTYHKEMQNALSSHNKTDILKFHCNNIHKLIKVSRNIAYKSKFIFKMSEISDGPYTINVDYDIFKKIIAIIKCTENDMEFKTRLAYICSECPDDLIRRYNLIPLEIRNIIEKIPKYDFFYKGQLLYAAFYLDIKYIVNICLMRFAMDYNKLIDVISCPFKMVDPFIIETKIERMPYLAKHIKAIH
jgi:hypothetical protein